MSPRRLTTTRPAALVARVVALVLTLVLGSVICLPATADTATPSPEQTETVAPTATPTESPDDTASPDQPTGSATGEAPTRTPSASASAAPPTPSLSSSTGGPTATAGGPVSPTASPSTPGPVITVPGTPPAAVSTEIPLTSAIIAFVVLLLVGLLLRELTTSDAAPQPETAGLEPADGTARTVSEDDVLLLMSTAGDALIEAGFDVSDVQSDLRHIAAAHHVRDVQVLAMPTMLLVSTRSGAGIRTSVMATGSRPLRLHQIEALDDVVTRARRGLEPRRGILRIAEIRNERPPFPAWVQLLGGVLATLGLAVLLGASWRGMVVSGVLGGLTGALLLVGQRVPMRYQALVTVTAASLVSLVVFLLARLGWSTDIVPSLIAPLITLLPGALLTTGVIELASGQPISGAGRLAAGGTQLTLLALGIVGPALLVGVPTLELTTTEPALGSVGPWIAVAAFGIGIVVNRCARPRSMGWMLMVLYVAYGAQVLGGLVLGGELSGFVGALAMTPVADLIARQRFGPPAIVSFSPAFWILVPGALGLMGVATLISGDDAGRDTVLTTVVTMVAVALGVLVGRAVSTLLGLRRDRPE